MCENGFTQGDGIYTLIDCGVAAPQTFLQFLLLITGVGTVVKEKKIVTRNMFAYTVTNAPASEV